MPRGQFPERWLQIQRKHRATVPKGSPFSAYQEAMQRARAEYRGELAPPRSNPDRRQLLRLGLIGAGLIYLGKQLGWIK